MKQVDFKIIEEDDLPVILDIYNHYILTTTATFRLEPISIETLKEFIFLDHAVYKAYLIYHQNEIAGFCFLAQYRKLEAYNRTAEMGIYIKPAFTNQGLGPKAVKHLESVAVAHGLKTLIASISGENSPSIKMFQKLNYQQCGHFKKVGEKFNRVLDVIFYQRSLENDITPEGNKK